MRAWMWMAVCVGGFAACVSSNKTDPSLNAQTDARRPVKVCSPGERRCHTDGLSVMVCNGDGTALCFEQDCAAPPTEGVCATGRCIPLCQPQQKSYMGCEYFAVDLDNARVPCGTGSAGEPLVCDAAASQYALVVSNPHPTEIAYVTVSRKETFNTVSSAQETCAKPPVHPGLIEAKALPPQGLAVFKLSPEQGVEGTVLAPLAYRVASNLPVTAYQFNPLDNVGVFSNDASLLLPVVSLGRQYRVVSREQSFEELKGFLTVVGVDRNDTQVSVTVTAPTLGGRGIPALNPGDTWSTTLKRFDVLNIETRAVGADLTGSHVVASNPVAVFGGSEAANVPNSDHCDMQAGVCQYDRTRACSSDDTCRVSALITCCADHLEMQMFPIETWGYTYSAVRSYPRGKELDAWRVVASEDGTEVVFNPGIHPNITLQAGGWFEWESGEDFVVTANKPVMLAQYLMSQDAPYPGRQQGDAGTGDPSLMLVPPVHQWRTSYVFLAPDKYVYDYVSMAVRTEGAVLLDGNPLETLPDVRIADIGQTGLSAVRVGIADGFHEVLCPDRCSVMVHGYDQYVSYGYPAGLDLSQSLQP
jgi:hypothetical protein